MIAQASHALIDAIINHPTVRPTAQGGTYRLTSAELLARGAVAYASPQGCLALFVPTAQGAWEGHIFALAGARGATIIRHAQLALSRLFIEQKASVVVAAVPMCLPAARFLCRRLGFTPQPLDMIDTLEQVERFKMEACHGRNS
jgi:hypothetical protein